jgi:hypothetical protein
MRPLSSVGLVASLLLLAACEDVTGDGGLWRSQVGRLDANGDASVELPASVASPARLPALTCYTADPADPPDARVWFAVSSAQLPARVGTVDVPTSQRVLSNCLVETSALNSNRLVATLEGETPGWLYQFVVAY